MAKKQKKQKNRKEAEKPLKPSVSKPKIAPINFWKDYAIAGMMLCFIAMAIYGSTIKFGYVLDDALVLTKNNDVKKGFAGFKDIMTKESFAGYFGEQKNLVLGARYRPLSLLTFATEFELFEQPGVDDAGNAIQVANSKVSHFINILLYGLTGLLLFRVLLQWFPVRAGRSVYWSMAWVVSLLFVLHPIHTEVVANVKGRDEILAFLLSLAMLYAVWKYFEKEKIAWLTLSAGFMMLGLLAKENALTFIAIVPLVGYFFRKTPIDRLLIATGTMFVVSLGYLILRSDVIGYFLSSGVEIKDIMNNPFYGLDFGEKFATIFYTLGLYLKLLLFPHPLTHDYYPFHIPVMSFGDWQVILSLLINVGLGLAALWGMAKKRIWSFGILFYFVTFSIVSNIPFTVGTFMNERFVYISSLGFCIVLGWLIFNYLPSKIEGNAKAIGMAIVAIFGLGFTVKTLTRVPVWESALTLNSAAIKVSPNSARANTFYGTAVFEKYKVETDRVEKERLLRIVEKHINRAVEINPDYFSALKMKVGVAAEVYKLDRDLGRILDEFYQVAVVKPQIPFIFTFLDYLMDRDEGDQMMRFAIRTGDALTAKRDYSNAIRYYNYGMKINPDDTRIRKAIGLCYQKAGDIQRAAQYLE